MPGVEGLQQGGGLAAAHLADDDGIGPVPQGVAHEVADTDRPLRHPRASNRTQCGRSMRSSKVSSMATIRSSSGSRSMSALRSVVLPLPVPPLRGYSGGCATSARPRAARARRARLAPRGQRRKKPFPEPAAR